MRQAHAKRLPGKNGGGGDDFGIAFPRKNVLNAHSPLSPGGTLEMEYGYFTLEDQLQAVGEHMNWYDKARRAADTDILMMRKSYEATNSAIIRRRGNVGSLMVALVKIQ
jgi:hypothetical protein